MRVSIFSSRSFFVLLQFMRRDFLVAARRFKDQFINIVLLYPVFLSINTVVISNVFFQQQDVVFGSTNLFAAALILPSMVLTYHLMFELFYDLEGSRFINYQMIVLDPALVLIEKLFVGTLVSFLSIAPFYPLSYLFVSFQYVSVDHANWWATYGVLIAASFCLCAYNLCAAVLLTKETLNIFWNRINHCLLMFGGFLIPSSLLSVWWKPAGYLLYLNPLHFFSEGVRNAILGSQNFLHYSICITSLCVLGLLFTLILIYAFKKRVDHI